MNLLRRNAAFRRLWLARFVSFLGDAIGLVALILLVADETDSSAAVGLLLLAGDFTPALLAPLLGALADRADARAAMVTCEVGQAVAVGLIVVLQPPIAVTLLLVAARSLLAATFQATSRRVVPDLVDDDELESANALIGVGTSALEALGPLLTAALLLVMEPRGVLVIDAATFLVSPLLLAGLPTTDAVRDVDAERPRLFVDARVGLGALWRTPLVRTVAVGFWFVAACTAVDDVALAFLGRDTFGSGDAGVSVLYAGSGIGLLAGFAWLGRRRGAAWLIAVAGFAIASAGNLLTGLAPALALAIAAQAGRGIGNAHIDVGTSTLIQREVPRELRGRVFANVFGGVGVAAGLSYVVGGALVDVAGPRAVLVGAGVGGLVTAAACAALAARE